MASTEARSKAGGPPAADAGAGPGSGADAAPPAGAELDLLARIAMLEERLAEIETHEGAVFPLERLLGGMLPPEAREHMRAARREQLLVARSLIDHWIERVDRKPMPKERRRRESIRLE